MRTPPEVDGWCREGSHSADITDYMEWRSRRADVDLEDEEGVLMHFDGDGEVHHCPTCKQMYEALPLDESDDDCVCLGTS